MAVKGLDKFIDYFAEYRKEFVLIGGAACDLWFTGQNLAFRATNDLDVVLILEQLTPEFVTRFRAFVRDGGYEVRLRSEDGPPVLYRFAKPKSGGFPSMVELFCRAVPELDLAPDQKIIPVRLDEAQSLSAILLHDSYYRYLIDHCSETRGISVADAAALIPLKARAWLDLTLRKATGEKIDEDDIRKHRNDVFRLAVILPGGAGIPLPPELATDVTAFLSSHPPDDPGWDAIRQSIRLTVGGTISPEKLIAAIRTYYRLPE